MPTNQRQNERKARQRRRAQKTKRILWCLIILLSAVLIVLKICEIDFHALKNRFVDSQGKFTFVQTADETAYPVALDSSKNLNVYVQNNKLNVLTDISCSVINPTDGKTLYAFNHGYAHPIVKTAGSYFCVIDQGANRLRLDSLHENVYTHKTEYAILTAAVAKNGNVIYATKSRDNKSVVYVKNTSLKTLMQLDVNDGYVTAVAIDASGKKCAYAVINSKNANLVTTVHTVNIGDGTETAAFEYTSTNILEMHYISSHLYVIGSNALYCIQNQHKQKEVFAAGSVNTVCYNFAANGELIYVYAKYSAANENFLVHINGAGKKKTTVELKQKPKYVSSQGNEICVLFSDNAAVYSLTKGEKKERYACDDSVSSANKLSSKVFVSRHQLIDVLE